MSHYGFQTSAWLRIDGDCAIAHDTTSGEAELTLGGRQHDVQIVASEGGLGRLIGAATEALAALQSQEPSAAGPSDTAGYEGRDSTPA